MGVINVDFSGQRVVLLHQLVPDLVQHPPGRPVVGPKRALDFCLAATPQRELETRNMT
jgi:hypothetical protein